MKVSVKKMKKSNGAVAMTLRDALNDENTVRSA